MNPLPEISRAILNSGLDNAVHTVKRGKPFSEAVDAAVQHIRSRESLSMRDEARVRDWLSGELPNALRAAGPRVEPQEQPEANVSEDLYQRIGPGQFSPVGKPPFIFPPLWLYRLIDGRTTTKHSAECLQRRKIIAAVSGFAFLLVGLFPPWIQTFDLNTTHTRTDAGYAFLLSPPAPKEYSYSIGIQLDVSRLWIELACVMGISVAAWFLFGSEKKNSRKS